MQGASPVAHRWFLARTDRPCHEAVDGLVETLLEELAIATSAAVSVRMLSGDGRRLVPIGAHHPDPSRSAAMLKVMTDTEQPADSGLWEVVLRTGRPARWYLHDGEPPPEASDHQAAFIEQHVITAVLGLPCSCGDTWSVASPWSGTGATTRSPTTTRRSWLWRAAASRPCSSCAGSSTRTSRTRSDHVELDVDGGGQSRVSRTAGSSWMVLLGEFS